MIRLEVQNADTLDRLRDFPQRLNTRLADVMTTFGLAVQDRARDIAGGKLGDAVAVTTEPASDGVAVSIGVSDVPYAALREYGFHGIETVRAHLRMIKEAFGRPITPREIAVRSYARRVDVPAHSYLRAALDDMAGNPAAEIGDAITDQASA